MSRKETIESKAEALIHPILDRKGFELVDLEYVREAGQWYLRAYIDKPGGITIDDCEAVSREFNDLLDRDDFIPDSYIMEISSPGLGRPLKKEKDFARNIGKHVELKLYQAVNGRKEFDGILASYTDSTVTVDISGEGEKEFARKDLAMIRQAVDF
ncbi:MAG: ribosome maturation factor RimP [Lachnospiraceae bacterium]|jgi:ribosome maturation factor RimP